MSRDRMESFMMRKLKEIRWGLGTIDELDDEIARDYIITKVFHDSECQLLSMDEIEEIIENIFYRTRKRLSILHPLAEDESITEIMVNGPKNIFIEKGGKMERYHKTFQSVDELEEVLMNIAGDVHREINEMNPIVDARLKDGSRVNGVYKNVAVNGPILTIRKFQEGYMRMDDLVGNGSITEEGAELLSLLVECGYNIFISGGTSSGKTTLLNALAESVPKSERVIVIEDSMELKLPNIENIVRMECRNSNSEGKGEINMAQLIKSSLRMRPDRIIVGEVRGGEVVDMLQAMNTGHSGSLSTGHGNSVEGMLRRLESMYLMAVTLNIEAIRGQISQGIDIMVHIEKVGKGNRRVMEISQLLGYDGGKFKLNKLMKVNNNMELEITGNKMVHLHRVFLKGEEYADRLQKLALI